MNLRRVGIGALVLVTLAAAGFGLSALTSELPQIPERDVPSILIVRNPPALNAVEENFSQRMGELGYVEGGRASYTRIDVGTDLPGTEQRIAAVLDEQDVDLIFAMGVIAARAAKQVVDERGGTTPIIFGVVSDPVGVGLVQSIRSSGNNVTGITPANDVTASKRLEFLKEILPDTRRIIVAWNDENTAGVEGIRRVVQGLGLELVEKRVANVVEMVAFLEAYDYEEGDAILRASDGVGAGALPETIRIATENKVPLVGTNSGDTERGALMSFGADYREIGRANARLADMVLRGTRPGDIPVEEASRFEISVNMDTAAGIGVTIPQSFLLKTNVVVSKN